MKTLVLALALMPVLVFAAKAQKMADLRQLLA